MYPYEIRTGMTSLILNAPLVSDNTLSGLLDGTEVYFKGRY